jgi:ABC-type nitrate/sulfonate/bicarbonate transport system permease component
MTTETEATTPTTTTTATAAPPEVAPDSPVLVEAEATALTTRRRSWRRLGHSKWVLRLVFYGLLVVAWQLTSMWRGEFFLPSVPSTMAAIGEFFSEGYYEVLGPTLQQLAAGFLIAMVIAIPVGALMGRFRIMEDLLSPYVNTLFVTSKESLLPILIIAFGIAFWYRVSVVILFALFFPVINTAAGVRYVDRELKETARAFATPPLRMFTRIYLPAAAPFVVAGIRLGLGMALKGMIIAELWIFAGTGELFTRFTLSPRRLDLYFALAIVIVAIAVSLNGSLQWVERKLRPYARDA